MKLRAGVTDKTESTDVPVNDTTNVQINDTIKISQLTEIQKNIYEIIKSSAINDTINAQTLSDALGASVITIKRDLYVLRDMNLIKYVGSNKTGHWEIIPKILMVN